MSPESARQASDTAGGGATPPEAPPETQLTSTLARVAPGIFVLLWATGFLIAKLGVPYAQPLTILAIRFVLAAMMMAGVAFAMRAPWPRSWRRIGHIATIGILLHAVYLGGCYIAIYAGMPAGMAALIVGFPTDPDRGHGGTDPRRAHAAAAMDRHRHRLRRADDGAVGADRDRPQPSGGAAVRDPVAARHHFGDDLSEAVLPQLRPALGHRDPVYRGVADHGSAHALSLGIGEIDWAPTFIFALAWLVIVLSGVSIALLTWMISRGAASKVASLFYLTPPIAAIGSYFWFDETLSPLALAGMAVIVFGLYLLNLTRKA